MQDVWRRLAEVDAAIAKLVSADGAEGAEGADDRVANAARAEEAEGAEGRASCKGPCPPQEPKDGKRDEAFDVLGKEDDVARFFIGDVAASAAEDDWGTACSGLVWADMDDEQERVVAKPRSKKALKLKYHKHTKVCESTWLVGGARARLQSMTGAAVSKPAESNVSYVGGNMDGEEVTPSLGCRPPSERRLGR